MKENISTVSWLFKRNRRYLPVLLLIALVSMLLGFIGVKHSLVVRDVIDAATGAGNKGFRAAVITLLIHLIITLGLRLLKKHLSSKTAFLMDREWKQNLMHELLYDDYAKVVSYHSGNLLERMNSDVRSVNNGLIVMIPGVLTIITSLVMAIIYMVQLEPKLTFIVCAGGIAIVIASAVIRNYLKDLYKQSQEANAKVSSFIQETISRLLVVQALDAGEEIEKREDALLEERYHLQRKRKNVGLVTGGGLSLILLAGEFCILFYCVLKLRQGLITFGTLVAMIQLFAKLESPFVNMSGIIPKYVAALGSAERLKEICELNENDTAPGLLPAIDGNKTYEQMISFTGRNICFRYEDSLDEEYVLDNVSFDIPKNSFCAITGQSGIGKSTLLKLFLGIYKPESGEMKVVTEDRDISIDRTTRSLFAYVPQGNMLMSGTLRENLLLTKPEASDTELDKAIRIAELEDFISELPEGLDTKIGENALGISEGQAQRISIARAILSRKPVILLDEATSALDAETERRVLYNIKGIPEITCIAVTHRPAAVEMSDTVISL